MVSLIRRFVFLLLVSAVTGYPQPVAVTIGYQAPGTTLAPGQVVTIFVHGLNLPEGTDVQAQGLPLPFELAGVSAMLVQRLREGDPRAYPVPLFRVFTFPSCAGADTLHPCAIQTGLTVQIPFEASSIGVRPFPLFSDLVISHNGVAGPAVAVGMSSSVIHLLNTCDSLNPLYRTITYCEPLVVDVNGALTGPERRPSPGDALVFYAVGLGEPNPIVESGKASPTPPAELRRASEIQVEFQTIGAGDVGIVEAPAAFIGLTPGYVGLYQINVVVPKPAMPPAPCENGIRSNTRVTVRNLNTLSTDTIELCLETK